MEDILVYTDADFPTRTLTLNWLKNDPNDGVVNLEIRNHPEDLLPAASFKVSYGDLSNLARSLDY